MSFFLYLKHRVGTIVLPVARLYIRYFPLSFLKLFLFEHFAWRERNYSVRTRFGTKMAGSSMDLVQGFIYYFGIWEPNLTDFVDQRLKGRPERSFIDVGANVGYFSLLAARRLKKGKVVAIEAFPSIYDKLSRNIRLNGFQNIRPVACAATDGRRQIPMFHSGARNEGATTSVSGLFNSEPILVEGLPLSEILTRDEIASARLIKIDVEGAEYGVLQGMTSIISQLPSDVEIVVEITPSALGEERLRQVFDFFGRAGFFAYSIPNTTDPRSYLFSQQISRPTRMLSLPKLQTDFVFSRVDSDFL